MTTQEIAKQLSHYLKLYAIGQNKDYLPGILSFSGMLVGRVKQEADEETES